MRRKGKIERKEALISVEGKSWWPTKLDCFSLNPRRRRRWTNERASERTSLLDMMMKSFLFRFEWIWVFDHEKKWWLDDKLKTKTHSKRRRSRIRRRASSLSETFSLYARRNIKALNLMTYDSSLKKIGKHKRVFVWFAFGGRSATWYYWFHSRHFSSFVWIYECMGIALL